jgi:hypothetical protein
MAFNGSGAPLTSLNGSNISSGTVAPARLGSGTPSSSNFLRGDGSWQAAGGGQFQYAVFTSSGTWTCPSNVTKVFVWVVAGGTGAVRPYNGSYGASGGGEGVSAWGYYTVVPSTNYTVTIGSGGNGVNTSASSATSTSGGSSFGSFLTIGGSSVTQNVDTVSYSAGSVTGAPFGGRNFVPAIKPNLASKQGSPKNTGNNSATAWSTSDIWIAGSGGGFSGDTAIGGVGGGVYIEYIG